ncbi:unnamed protein product [Ranitomeya imitator]|uniref:SEA domain-containing protein n=1 Tax=Ranitomeya imitator TaxID=111125 RepID=A0ABN9M9D6_9NEOB|nr:unnamed protein product [Ranitomeya imitator]
MGKETVGRGCSSSDGVEVAVWSLQDDPNVVDNWTCWGTEIQRMEDIREKSWRRLGEERISVKERRRSWEDRRLHRSGREDMRNGGKMISSDLSTLSLRKREEKKEDMADRDSGILESRENPVRMAGLMMELNVFALIFSTVLCVNLSLSAVLQVLKLTVEKVEASLNVTVKFNQPFNESLNDNSSPEYKKFETEFKVKMTSVYQNVAGYKEVQIESIRSGSIIVDHKVIVEVTFKEGVNVTEECEEIFKEVEMKLNEDTNNCTDDLCFTEVTVTPGPLVTTDGICQEKIPEGFRDFYTPLVTVDGLTCVSYCEQTSPQYVNCNSGSCNIKKGQGPHCLCPETDLYIYTSSDCAGKLSKSGVYGGIGTAIAVLAIIVITVIVLLVREHKKKKMSGSTFLPITCIVGTPAIGGGLNTLANHSSNGSRRGKDDYYGKMVDNEYYHDKDFGHSKLSVYSDEEESGGGSREAFQFQFWTEEEILCCGMLCAGGRRGE